MNIAAGTAAMMAAMAEAVKASGAIVTVEPRDFETILAKPDKPLVVCAEGGFWSKHYKYLTSYKGLAFFARSPNPLCLSSRVEIIRAQRISIPD